ncbi:MAG: ABC transporter substrate-binding protein [Paracoccaceae bacterium]|nr:polyamine ABC trasnporter, periplasmic polyamine-binding protein [Rhodobacterales bacterium HTCC2150] [Rhodobacteraceae bacterium HTCC2150]MDG1532039.1 ABC transporter substrate-binding protein [Paracoccaceae bacterium]
MKIRTLLLGAAATVVAMPVLAAELTVVSWGGAYTVSQVEAYHKPWIAATGNSIVSTDYSGGLAEVKSQVEAGNVTWDLVDVELSDAIRGCDEGLFEEIDASMLPAAPDGTSAEDDFLPGTLHDCAVSNIFWTTLYAFNKDVYTGEQPTTMADFFDLEKFPGKRGVRKNPKAMLEMALMGDGVPAAEVYDVMGTEEGIARAFAKLDTIKDDVVWWEAGAQPPQLLADGEVTMTITWNGRIFNAIAQEGQPFGLVWDGQIYDLDLWAIPKGAPNKEAALDFVGFSTATEQLAAQASYIPYGPARKSSIPLIGTYYTDDSIQMIDHMPTTEKALKNALQNDYEFWADNQDELNERFNSWLAN